jgi:redox-sensitive bicupin YhaK (pirin superfamily)
LQVLASGDRSMMVLRRAAERGRAEEGWLDSRHTFSFADYYDPQFLGFGPLRVLNEDRVQPGKGFGTHSHRDMEIISYVLEGALEHKDSLGNGSVLRPGDVQRMSAGKGVEHSELNPSATEPVHFIQIWLTPERRFSADEKRGRLRLIASRDGRDGAVVVHQDVDLYAAVLAPGAEVVHAMRPRRKIWLQIANGRVTVNERELGAGDGAAVTDEEVLFVRGITDAEVLLFDMA